MSAESPTDRSFVPLIVAGFEFDEAERSLYSDAHRRSALGGHQLAIPTTGRGWSVVRRERDGSRHRPLDADRDR